MLSLDASFDGSVRSDYFTFYRTLERSAFYAPGPEPGPAMTSALQLAPWCIAAEQRLAWILSLPENWDGYGAAQVDHATVRRAWAFLRAVMPTDGLAPDIGPTNDGQLLFEWHRAGADFEIRIRPSGEFSVAFDDLRQPDRSWDETITPDHLQRVSDVIREISRHA
jgi:hypothetical protein